jgi:hypothetical protein
MKQGLLDKDLVRMELAGTSAARLSPFSAILTRKGSRQLY